MFSGIRDIEVKDALLAEAIQSLSEKRQKVVLQNIVKTENIKSGVLFITIDIHKLLR